MGNKNSGQREPTKPFAKPHSKRRLSFQILSLILVSVGVGFGQACSKGFEHTVVDDVTSASFGSNTPGTPGVPGVPNVPGVPGTQQPPPSTQPQIPVNLELTCKPDMDPAAVPLRRLSKDQFNNAMVEMGPGILGWSTQGNETFRLTGTLGTVMSILPGDIRDKNNFGTLDQTVSEYHVFSYFFIASAAADFAVASSTWLNTFGGSCMKVVSTSGAVTDACLDAFIDKLGRSALRKKITLAERNEFKTFFKEFPDTKNGTAAVIQMMLLHPRFTYMVEVDGKPVNGRNDLLELNDFEIVQRLSFFFLGAAPTQAMLADAEAGLFTASEESLKAEINKFFVTKGDPYRDTYPYNYGNNYAMIAPIQRNYSTFYDQLFEFSKMPALPEGALADTFKYIYNDPQRYSWAHNVDTDPYLPGESMNFVNRLTWFENKKFSDLMTDNTTVMQGGVAAFYGVPQVSGVTTLPNRAGILTRAAFLVTGDVDSHPFTRGAFIRRSILCDQLPSPNPDALPDRALSPPEANPLWNNRDRYAHKTADTACMSCHAQINPLAFALEDFDSLARNRNGNIEGVFKLETAANGSQKVTVVGKPMTNAVVQNLQLSSNEVIPQVNGGIELSKELARSPKANMCFARQLFRYTFGRYETNNDACMLQDMYSSGTAADGSIKRMITNAPLSKHFKLKKVGP